MGLGRDGVEEREMEEKGIRRELMGGICHCFRGSCWLDCIKDDFGPVVLSFFWELGGSGFGGLLWLVAWALLWGALPGNDFDFVRPTDSALSGQPIRLCPDNRFGFVRTANLNPHNHLHLPRVPALFIWFVVRTAGPFHQIAPVSY